MIHAEIPRTRFANIKDDPSKMSSELAYELSSDDRGGADIVEVGMV